MAGRPKKKPEYNQELQFNNFLQEQVRLLQETPSEENLWQADISRIENGTRNPSLSMVKKLAHGLGMQLKLEFVPMPTKNKM